MSFDVLPGLQLQERMQQAAVRHIDLGRLHLSFAQVLEPGEDLPQHQRRGEQVEVAADRHVGDPEGAGELRSVPYLPVVVSDHRPEASERLGRDADSKRREIPLQEGADEPTPPFGTVAVRRSDEGARKAAPQPELLAGGDSHLVEIEAPELVVVDAAGQRFGGLP